MVVLEDWRLSADRRRRTAAADHRLLRAAASQCVRRGISGTPSHDPHLHTSAHICHRAAARGVSLEETAHQTPHSESSTRLQITFIYMIMNYEYVGFHFSNLAYLLELKND